MLFITFVFNLFQALLPFASPSVTIVINVVCMTLAAYFKMSPSQTY